MPTRTAGFASQPALLGRRTARNDAAACQDEPIAAPFLNSQDAPRPRDKISGRYLLRTRATLNHRDVLPCILDAIVSEQGPRVVGSGCFIRGGSFRPCHKRRLFRRGRGRGLAELAPATAAFFSNLLSLVVRPAISEDGAAVTATFFSKLSSLATTSAESETGVAGKAVLSPAHRASPQYRQIWRRNLGPRAR